MSLLDTASMYGKQAARGFCSLSFTGATAVGMQWTMAKAVTLFAGKIAGTMIGGPLATLAMPAAYGAATYAAKNIGPYLANNLMNQWYAKEYRELGSQGPNVVFEDEKVGKFVYTQFRFAPAVAVAPAA